MTTVEYTIECRYNPARCNMIFLTEGGYTSEFWPTKDTPYLALAGELWGVFCEDFAENWPRYNDTAMYIKISSHNPHLALTRKQWGVSCVL